MTKLKKVTYKNSFRHIKWKNSVEPKEGQQLIIDLRDLCFMSAISYIKQPKGRIQFVYDFLNDIYIDHIEKIVFDHLNDLKNSYNVIIVGDSNEEKDIIEGKPSLSNLNPFDVNSYDSYIKLINEYIKNTKFVHIFQKYIPDIILPDEFSLNDSAIEIALTDGIPYTHDLDVLIYGKSSIFKRENGEWYCKETQDLKSILPKSRQNDDILYTCILLGTSYAHAEKTTKKRDILNDPNKYESTCKLLESRDQHEYLQFIKRLKGIDS